MEEINRSQDLKVLVIFVIAIAIFLLVWIYQLPKIWTEKFGKLSLILKNVFLYFDIYLL